MFIKLALNDFSDHKEHNWFIQWSFNILKQLETILVIMNTLTEHRKLHWYQCQKVYDKVIGELPVFLDWLAWATEPNHKRFEKLCIIHIGIAHKLVKHLCKRVKDLARLLFWCRLLFSNDVPQLGEELLVLFKYIVFEQNLRKGFELKAICQCVSLPSWSDVILQEIQIRYKLIRAYLHAWKNI